MSVELDKDCENCGTKFKQHVSVSENNGRMSIRVYRYKCPFCDVFIMKPTVEEIRRACKNPIGERFLLRHARR